MCGSSWRKWSIRDPVSNVDQSGILSQMLIINQATPASCVAHPGHIVCSYIPHRVWLHPTSCVATSWFENIDKNIVLSCWVFEHTSSFPFVCRYFYEMIVFVLLKTMTQFDRTYLGTCLLSCGGIIEWDSRYFSRYHFSVGKTLSVDNLLEVVMWYPIFSLATPPTNGRIDFLLSSGITTPPLEFMCCVPRMSLRLHPPNKK